jgi:hypothetical protein
MDGRGAGVQSRSHLRLSPVALAGIDISCEYDPRMEPFRRCGSPGMLEAQHLCAFLKVESDHRLDHHRSPRWGHALQEN